MLRCKRGRNSKQRNQKQQWIKKDATASWTGWPTTTMTTLTLTATATPTATTTTAASNTISTTRSYKTHFHGYELVTF